MKSIETLSWILRFFGWFGIVFGFLFFLMFLLTGIFANTISATAISSIPILLTGLVYLCLASGLSKKEKWAWYSALIVFSLAIFSITIISFFFGLSFEFVINLGLSIFFIYLLIKGKQLFIEQPKEKISQWFRKSCFVMVVVGTFLSYLIKIGILAYYY